MWTTVEFTNGGISLIGKAGVLKTPSNHVKVMCRFESDFLLYQINEIMSYGKKCKMTRKQIGRNPHSRRWKYKVCGGRKGKCRFQFFRHKKWFKTLEGKISMRFAMSREIWYWD